MRGIGRRSAGSIAFGRQSSCSPRSWPRSWWRSPLGDSATRSTIELSQLTSIPAVAAWLPGTNSPEMPARSMSRPSSILRAAPAPARDPKYVAVVDNLRRAGGRVFGYVSTQYGNRDLNAVIKDIENIYKFYNINGIFVDEMASGQETCPYYEKYLSIHQSQAFRLQGGRQSRDALHARTIPGCGRHPGDLRRPRRTLMPISNRSPSRRGLRSTRANRFANIVYGVSSDAGLRRALGKTRQSNAGSIFITDGRMPNPYNGLPPYWAQEVAAIQTPDLSVTPTGALNR